MNSSKLQELIQNYLGMKPADVGCKNYPEMGKKMSNEILKVLSKSSEEDLVKENSEIKQHLSHVRSSLLLSGKMALAGRAVVSANTKNLSDRIAHLENSINEYDNEIMALHDTKTQFA